MIYLDNSATSFPKPETVGQAMLNFINNIGANPGRSGHVLSIEAAKVVYYAREEIAELFGVSDPLRVVFSSNATESINMAIKGMCKPGDHVLVSPMEHNAVMRCLENCRSHDVSFSVLPSNDEGMVLVDKMAEAILPNTVLIIVNHVSNVSGLIQPIREIGKTAKELNIPFLIDAAQSAGVFDINMETDNIDLVAFTGHKALYGPQGTGGLVIADEFSHDRIAPLKYGGTGSKSECEVQPSFLPDKFESGTQNAVGIAGLLEGVKYIKKIGLDNIRAKEKELAKRLYEGLSSIPGIKIYSKNNENYASTIPFTIDSITTSEISDILNEKYGVLCRAGLHCSPGAHSKIGTYPDGTARLSPGWFTTQEEIDKTIEAIKEMVNGS
ncbi:MAG: aminotransferase class V-fold PLP-dependent enzyme [Candidatus Cloacimonadia bacterium]